jgi:hypothetical protein
VDQLVLEPCPLGELPRWLMLAVRRQGRGGVVAGNGDGRLGQAAPVGGDAGLDGPGEVLPQVEAAGDLDRARRPGAGAVGEC